VVQRRKSYHRRRAASRWGTQARRYRRGSAAGPPMPPPTAIRPPTLQVRWPGPPADAVTRPRFARWEVASPLDPGPICPVSVSWHGDGGALRQCDIHVVSARDGWLGSFLHHGIGNGELYWVLPGHISTWLSISTCHLAIIVNRLLLHRVLSFLWRSMDSEFCLWVVSWLNELVYMMMIFITDCHETLWIWCCPVEAWT